MSKTQPPKNLEINSSPMMVPIGKLIEDPENVRQTRTDVGIEALADNIHAEGLLQNLVVRKVKGGKYAVTAGERRRSALQMLVKRKLLKATDTVPCRLIDGPNTSASLSENIHRVAMHPADQYVAWAKMHDDGLSIPEISKRHGTTTKVVEQRLKLGRLSPVILNALKNDEIDVETACSFAITDDHKRQESVYEALNAQYYGPNARNVKAALTKDEIAGSNKLAVFVGREAYEQAGGEIRTDLFDDDMYFKDAELLTQLANQKLQAEAERLKSEGWSWIEIAFDQDYRALDKLRKIHPEAIALSPEDQAEKERLEKRYEEIEGAANGGDEDLYAECEEIDAKLNALSEKAHAFKPDDLAISGGFVYLTHDGGLSVQLGYVRPEDDPQLAEKKRMAAEARAAAPSQYTKALRDDLASLRREIFQSAFLNNPAIARDLLAFHTIRQTLHAGYLQSPFNLSANESSARPSKAGDMGTMKGRKKIQKMISSLPLECIQMEDPTAGFEVFHGLSDDQKAALQAYAAALMLEPQLSDDSRPEPTLERAAQLMDVDVADHWTPSHEFFERLNKKHMGEIAESLISSSYAETHAKDKKQAFAKALGKAFNSRGVTQSVDQEARQRMAKWAPECMQVQTLEATAS